MNFDPQREQRPDVEPDPAARRREDGAAGGIVNGDAAESKRDAAVAARQRRRANRNEVARTKSLLETAGDARIEKLEVDRPPGEQCGEPANCRCDHQDGDKDGADSDAARAPAEQWLARSRQALAAAAVQQASNCGSRLGPRRCVNAADQTPQVSARSSTPFGGSGRRGGPLSPRSLSERPPPAWNCSDR